MANEKPVDLQITQTHTQLNDISLPHNLLLSIEKKLQLVLTYKHFYIITLDGDVEQLYALLVNATNSLGDSVLPPGGTTPFQDRYLQDYERMGVTGWRLASMNKQYHFSPTYPSLFYVPTKISDNTVKHIGSFRSKQRIPVLSYRHSSGFSITRCAQPMVGMKGVKNIQDQKLVKAIFQTHGGDIIEKETDNLITDARPMTNAMAQTAMSAGTESNTHPRCFF